MEIESFDTLKSMQGDGFWYLATPYSKYEAGITCAYEDACRAAARLIQNGVRAFSPIAHSHPIAIHGNIDPMDHTIWMPVDEPMMRAAMGLLVIEMPGWQDSYGVGEEIRFFSREGKPILHVRWPL